MVKGCLAAHTAWHPPGCAVELLGRDGPRRVRSDQYTPILLAVGKAQTSSLVQTPNDSDSTRLHVRFNHTNGIDLIGRAHQLVMDGYKWMFNEVPDGPGSPRCSPMWTVFVQSSEALRCSTQRWEITLNTMVRRACHFTLVADMINM